MQVIDVLTIVATAGMLVVLAALVQIVVDRRIGELVGLLCVPAGPTELGILICEGLVRTWLAIIAASAERSLLLLFISIQLALASLHVDANVQPI